MTALTIEDVNKYLTMIRINFENSYKAQNDEERILLLQSWYAILKDYPKEVCDKAVIEAIKHAKFAPRIGDVVEQIEKMQVAYEKTDMELWAELTGVLREIRYCAYSFRFTAIQPNGKTQGENARDRVREIYKNFSPELKEYVRNENNLLEIADLTESQLSYEKGRFLKTLPQIKERAKTRAQTGNMAGLLQGLNVFLLEEKIEH